MSDASLSITFTVDRTPEEAFAAITNVRGWWSGEIDGDTDVLGAEFTYRYQDIHRSTQKITELVPGRKVTWQGVRRLRRRAHPGRCRPSAARSPRPTWRRCTGPPSPCLKGSCLARVMGMGNALRPTRVYCRIRP
jgi:hypothetical protein